MTEVSPVETENPVGGFAKTVSHVVLGIYIFISILFIYRRARTLNEP